MNDSDIVLLKGNEAIAHAAIRCGADAFFGYPITPQSEVLETLALLKPWETTGMVVLQAESEVASINMLYGAGGTGKRAFTSSSSPGVALMQEGISYMAGAEIPGLIVNVQRGGPGLGTIQPSQSDYNQATRGGGNGDYNVIVLAPYSVQEMADFVDLAFELSFKYRNPAMILSDGVIGQMMEKVILPPIKPRRTEEQIAEECPWATNGHGLKNRKPNILSSLELDPAIMEERNLHLQKKYDAIKENEVRYETIENELDNRTHSFEKFSYGVERFVIGLAKKVLIANQLGQLCKVFTETNEKTILFYWIFAVGYMLQIYFDFSAYSDMAIGLGKMFGFDFLENFDYPYISKSITEFWRRWHISLGTWFKDYVYIPLGGSREGTKKLIINI